MVIWLNWLGRSLVQILTSAQEREREKYKIGPLTKKFVKGCILIIQGKISAKE